MPRPAFTYTTVGNLAKAKSEHVKRPDTPNVSLKTPRTQVEVVLQYSKCYRQPGKPLLAHRRSGGTDQVRPGASAYEIGMALVTLHDGLQSSTR